MLYLCSDQPAFNVHVVPVQWSASVQCPCCTCVVISQCSVSMLYLCSDQPSFSAHVVPVQWCCHLGHVYHYLFMKDKVTNEKVREATALPKLEDIIWCRHLRWLGHLSRMDHHRLLQQALTWEPEGFKRGQVVHDRTGKMSSRKISG